MVKYQSGHTQSSLDERDKEPCWRTQSAAQWTYIKDFALAAHSPFLKLINEEANTVLYKFHDMEKSV